MGSVLTGALSTLFNTFGNRVIAAVVAGAGSYVAKHLGVLIDPAALTSLALGLYGVVHATLDRLQSGKPAAAK